MRAVNQPHHRRRIDICNTAIPGPSVTAKARKAHLPGRTRHPYLMPTCTQGTKSSLTGSFFFARKPFVSAASCCCLTCRVRWRYCWTCWAWGVTQGDSRRLGILVTLNMGPRVWGWARGLLACFSRLCGAILKLDHSKLYNTD